MLAPNHGEKCVDYPDVDVVRNAPYEDLIEEEPRLRPFQGTWLARVFMLPRFVFGSGGIGERSYTTLGWYYRRVA
jgi:hypothetical protein